VARSRPPRLAISPPKISSTCCIAWTWTRASIWRRCSTPVAGCSRRSSTPCPACWSRLACSLHNPERPRDTALPQRSRACRDDAQALTFNKETHMAIKAGDKMPAGTFKTKTKDGIQALTTDELFKGKTVVLFSVPGAFTPTCDAKHLPGYVDKASAIKA